MNTTSHDISLKMRKDMNITGVIDVISFDENSVVLKTNCGDMTLEGANIQIKVLDMDRGIVELEGKIDSLYYSDTSTTNEKHSLFGKIFK